MLEAVDAGRTNPLTEAEELAEAGEGEGVEAVEAVNADEVEATADEEDAEEGVGGLAAVSDTAVSLSIEKGVFEATSFSEGRFLGEILVWDEGV